MCLRLCLCNMLCHNYFILFQSKLYPKIHPMIWWLYRYQYFWIVARQMSVCNNPHQPVTSCKSIFNMHDYNTGHKMKFPSVLWTWNLTFPCLFSIASFPGPRFTVLQATGSWTGAWERGYVLNGPRGQSPNVIHIRHLVLSSTGLMESGQWKCQISCPCTCRIDGKFHFSPCDIYI